MFIWHLEVVERVDGQDVEACAAVDEGLGNLHVANDWGAKHREGASGGCALELIHRAERDGACRPRERVCGLELGKGCIYFAGELLEDALGGWGLSSTQDAGDRTWLLEAPSPLVLMTVFISPWLRRQRREACVALRAILARLIPLVSDRKSVV